MIWASILLFQKLETPLQIINQSIIEIKSDANNDTTFCFKKVEEAEILKFQKKY